MGSLTCRCTRSSWRPNCSQRQSSNACSPFRARAFPQRRTPCIWKDKVWKLTDLLLKSVSNTICTICGKMILLFFENLHLRAILYHLSSFCLDQNQLQKLLFHLNQFWEAFQHKMGFNIKGIQNLVFETDFTTYLLLSLTQLCHLLHGSAHWKLVGLRVNHGLLKNRRKKERKVNFFSNQSGFDSFAEVVHSYFCKYKSSENYQSLSTLI